MTDQTRTTTPCDDSTVVDYVDPRTGECVTLCQAHYNFVSNQFGPTITADEAAPDGTPCDYSEAVLSNPDRYYSRIHRRFVKFRK